MPIIEFLAAWVSVLLPRMKDQRTCCPCNKKNSKSKTIHHFMETYSGPDFEYSHKMAHMVMMIFSAFLYGPGMPILFVLCLLYLIINYSVERLSLAYFYRKPPMFDSSLNMKTLSLLRQAPIFYTIMSIWLFSNQQVFRNVFTNISNDSL